MNTFERCLVGMGRSGRAAVASLLVCIAAALALGAAGCAQVGAPAPQSFLERAAVAQIAVTTIRTTATGLLNSGAINVADARNAQATANAGNEAIDLALGFYGAACPPTITANCTSVTADAKLSAAVAILTATQSYLASKGKK